MKSQCRFWLSKKNRFCANTPLSNSVFCGNHIKRSDSRWIQCPIDPSHSVLQENLESHVKRCPLLKQVQSLSLQPFYRKGINSGKDEENEREVDNNRISIPESDTDFDASSKLSSGSLCDITSEMKRKAVYAMSLTEFSKLISKIKSVHASLCNEIHDSFKIPEACGIWINREVDRKLPYQEKHVLQQASILGNLEEYGVLRNSCLGIVSEQVDSIKNDVPAVVEFGAGRGYLTQMLADCYGIKKVILVERKSYKLKADRSLRQKDRLILERLRIDIEDLNVNAVASLHGVPYLAIGKHLCGPATDMTLRCCLCEEGNDENIQSGAINHLSGLAIATCCHHLCQWKHYINKRYFSNLGITRENFHAITWFTSWAVDADHGSDLCGVDDSLSPLHVIENELCVRDLDSSGVEDILRNTKAVERAVLGFMCKDIIDMGRLMWLKEQGLEAQLVKYVSSSVSPENHLLIARCSK